jgi:5,10-methylenetetrahydrofolate reductase
LVLFGDPLPGTSVRKYGFAKTRDLIQSIVSVCETRKPCIGAVTNQYAANQENEVSRTLGKVDAGADFIVTNVTFDADQLLNHVDNLRSRGLRVPLLAQVSIPASLANLKFLHHKFDIPVPSSVLAEMSRKDDPRPGISVAARAFKRLRNEVDGIHFSYLLRSRNPIPIYHVLLEGLGIKRATAGYQSVVQPILE